MLVTLDEAKEYLRVDFDDDNSLVPLRAEALHGYRED